MNHLTARTAGLLPAFLAGAASAQSGGPMMQGNGGAGWMGGWMGGYGGYWVPVLVLVVIGLLAWIVIQRRK